MVARGVAFLESSALPPVLDEYNSAGLVWLIGITLVKNGKDETHPIVAGGIKRCQDAAAGKEIPDQGNVGTYGLSLAVIFLCEVDPVKYKKEIAYFFGKLLKLQLSNGPWTYPGGPLGDTSQTQYGVLALWTADHAGVEVPTEAIERVCGWLMRTQDTGGGWAYLTQDSPAGRTNQSGVTHSLTAAGLSSTYICADLLGLGGTGEAAPADDNDGLPASVKKVKEEKEKKAAAKRKRSTKIDVGFLRRSQADGNAWMEKYYTVSPREWALYYLYALERYKSFKELADGKIEKEPKWYDDGVGFLKGRQQGNGSWSGDNGEQASTCFAILFLIRSTQRKLGVATVTEGALAGGRGLPTDVTNVRMKGNQVVGVTAAKSIDDVLGLLEGTDEAELEKIVDNSAGIALGADATTRAKQVQRLRKIVSQANYQARIVAVKTLSQARDLENVPVLIYALGDPDWRVAKEARDGLKLISRRFDGFGMPDNSTAAQRAAAQQSWKQWYLSIRPEAEFLD
jgi:hypothetical protein